MEMAADAPQAPTVRQKPARIGARAGRKYSDHFDGSSCCVSAASASSSPAASRGGRLLLPNVPHLAIERLSGVGSAPPHALPSQPLARSAGGTDCHGGGTGAGTGAVEYGADGWGADGWGDLRSTYRSAAGGPLDSIVPGHSAPSDDRRVGGVDLGGGGAPSNTAGDVAMYRPTHAHELQQTAITIHLRWQPAEHNRARLDDRRLGLLDRANFVADKGAGGAPATVQLAGGRNGEREFDAVHSRPLT